MAWRVARSLEQLLAQLNALYPHRSKVSDGSIGDAAHATRDSDHNPWYGPGIVTARDFTHDPAGGLDCNKLAIWLVTSGDRRIKYVIWNRRIWQGSWKAYNGTNPHDHHLHLSVVASPLCDDTTPWRLGEEDDMTPEELLNYPVKREAAKLGGNTSLAAVIAWFDAHIDEAAARDAALKADVAALKAKVDSLSVGGVDVNALAAALKPMLAAEVAKAVNDDADRRARDGNPSTGPIS